VTGRLGVIGKPLAHSLSPVFQQAALDALGIDACYEAWETDPRELASMLERLRGPHYLGANITIPYKEAVAPLLDGLEEEAAILHAANTIVNREGRLLGYNTDGQGFLRALGKAGFNPRGKAAVLIGAGGAARAVALALLREGVVSLAVANRTLERARRLAADLGPYRYEAELTALPLEAEALSDPLARCHLLVNCTSVGLAHSPQADSLPLPAHLIPPQALAYDIVANPEETPFLREARRRGAPTLGGLPMLVYQGAASFQLWLGREAPVEVMLAAARQAMAELGS